MSARVDNRDVLDRAFDVVSTAEFDLLHDEPALRCECGASTLTWTDDSEAKVCAGCGMAPSYELHPGASYPVEMGEWERGGSPETSTAPLSVVRKGVSAPGLIRTGWVAALSAVAVCLAPVIFRAGRR